MQPTAVQQRVIDRINREIGKDVNALHKSKNLIENYSQQFFTTKAKLSLADDTVELDVKTALRRCDHINDVVQIQLAKVDNCNEKVCATLQECEEILAGVAEPLTKVVQLEHLVEYFRVLDDIAQISQAIQATINGKDEHKLVGLYLSLSGERDSANSVIGRLEYVEAVNLKSYAEQTAIYWYDTLVEKFTKEFETQLKNIKWPCLGTELFNPSKDACNKLSLLAEYLFLIKSPADAQNELVAITPSILCPPIRKPIQLLLKTFRQRFLYHFSGAKQTNRLDKPEWFYTQILSWARENHLFVGSNFQTAALHSGHEDLNVRLEFIRGLVQLAMEKLCNDIEEISQDDHLFAHLLDETLSFEQELRETLRYPSTFPSALSVLTQAQYITKWLLAEENFSTSQMDAMLTTGSPWEFIDPVNIDELKIPKCADQFVRLLDAIKERYCALPQPGHQLQFLNLQLELIDSFRRRLVQLHNSAESNVSGTKVVNAINYVVSVLREWGENVHYLHLQVALMGRQNAIDDVASVFEKPIEEFEHWHRKIIGELSSKIVDDIKAKSMAYRHDNWIGMAEQSASAAKDTFALSTSAGEMFQLIVTVMHDLETELSATIFGHTMRLIANRLDDFFLDSMIMNTKFSAGGAAQFNYDMTRNLFALFGQYYPRPQLLFKKIHDSCVLLSLQKGSALLLRQTLRENIGGADAKSAAASKAALTEIGVITVKDAKALDILERRKDIVPY